MFRRIFDIVASFLGLVVASPLFVWIALKIKKEDGGPIFFKQKRIGINGRSFEMLKFRSMRVGSEDINNSLSEQEKKIFLKEFKLDKDPRITKFGEFIRKNSLDELPQLLNVLKGDMSIIGPRPIIIEEEKNYTLQERNRIRSIKPGITGYWQAYARNTATYESGDRQRMELYYIDNKSLFLDVRILLKTIQAVVTKKGAK